MSPYVIRALQIARQKAKETRSERVEEGHLLYGLLSSDYKLIHELNRRGITPDKVDLGRRERVPTQADNPATIDQLGRRAFAQVLARRIEEVWDSQLKKEDPGAFIIHIDGPWGSGKSSVLNLLREQLCDHSSRSWVVVDFNAWRNQRTRPPWWSLLTEIYSQSVRQLRRFRPRSATSLRAKWYFWRARNEWLPPILAIVLVIVTIVLFGDALRLTLTPTTQPAQGAPTSSPGFPDLIKGILGGIAGILALWAVVHTLARSLVFGSDRAAAMYNDLRSDPLRPVIRLFRHLITTIQLPLVVFIDDLDRCSSDYVIELLEGIQTLLRKESLIYVVAADRKWICSSFEKAYTDFAGVVGEPGRPLGYLFLDKVFQVSASLPRMPAELQLAFWKRLLTATPAADVKSVEKEQKKAQAEAEQRIQGIRTEKELQAAVSATSEDPIQQQAMRAAAAVQITTPDAMRETEHQLSLFAPLLEPNPRSMKRLVNTYGLHQATNFLEGRIVSPEALVRWTIIELRWPLLAEHLAQRPQSIKYLRSNDSAPQGTPPELLAELFASDQIKEEIRAVAIGRAELGGVLDEKAILAIVGT
jgi:hypothetical protein